MKMRLLVVLAAVLFMAGCTTITDPVSIGGGRYLITLNSRGGFQSDGELLDKSIHKAISFCARQGMQADVINTKTSGVQGWTPQDNQVEFKCVPKKK